MVSELHQGVPYIGCSMKGQMPTGIPRVDRVIVTWVFCVIVHGTVCVTGVYVQGVCLQCWVWVWWENSVL